MPEPTPAQAEALTRIADEFAGRAHQIRVLAQPGTPAQDAHTPRTAPQTRSGGTESGEVGLSGTCARCGAPITVPMNDPENREMAVCAPCEIGLLREGYQQARTQVDAVRSLAKQMRHEAASVQPMTERGVGLWDAAAAITYTLDGTRSEPAPDCSHSTATTDRK